MKLFRPREQVPDTSVFMRRINGNQYSRREIIHQALVVSDRLGEVGPAGILAVSGESKTLFWILTLGAWNAGWTVLPLGEEGQRRDQILDRVEPELIVSGAEAKFPELTSLDESAPDHPVPRDRSRQPTDTALLMATSGTTGRPKLIELTFKNLQHHITGIRKRLALSADDSWFDPLPVHHMGGLMPIVRTWVIGATVVFPDSTTNWWTGLDKTDATGLSVVPTMLDEALTSSPEGLANLRFVLTGGDRTPNELIRRCIESGIAVCPSYGLTEVTSTVAAPRPLVEVPEPGTTGESLEELSISIEDEAGRTVDTGESGRIVIEGPMVAEGIYGGRKFHGRFETGDYGRVEQGTLLVTGRRDDRIVSGGVTVETRELEEQLRELKEIQQVVVVGIENARWGQRPAAMIRATAEDSVVEDRLTEWNRERSPAFRLEFWRLVDEIPRTESGTVDRNRVKRLLHNTT